MFLFNSFPHSVQCIIIYVYFDSATDVVPDPPDGPPVIEAITGKNISLSWKKPKKVDPLFGTVTNPHSSEHAGEPIVDFTHTQMM